MTIHIELDLRKGKRGASMTGVGGETREAHNTPGLRATLGNTISSVSYIFFQNFIISIELIDGVNFYLSIHSSIDIALRVPPKAARFGLSLKCRLLLAMALNTHTSGGVGFLPPFLVASSSTRVL